jgi:hypothetical protein
MQQSASKTYFQQWSKGHFKNFLEHLYIHFRENSYHFGCKRVPDPNASLWCFYKKELVRLLQKLPHFSNIKEDLSLVERMYNVSRNIFRIIALLVRKVHNSFLKLDC